MNTCEKYEIVTNVDWPFPQHICTASSSQHFQDFLRQIFHLGCNAYQPLPVDDLPSTTPFQIQILISKMSHSSFMEKKKSFVLNVSCFLNNDSPYFLSACHSLQLIHLTRSSCFSSNLKNLLAKKEFYNTEPSTERIKIKLKGKTSQEWCTNSDHAIYASRFHLLYTTLPLVHQFFKTRHKYKPHFTVHRLTLQIFHSPQLLYLLTAFLPQLACQNLILNP